jgi:hypothetical protein
MRAGSPAARGPGEASLPLVSRPGANLSRVMRVDRFGGCPRRTTGALPWLSLDLSSLNLAGGSPPAPFPQGATASCGKGSTLHHQQGGLMTLVLMSLFLKPVRYQPVDHDSGKVVDQSEPEEGEDRTVRGLCMGSIDRLDHVKDGPRRYGAGAPTHQQSLQVAHQREPKCQRTFDGWVGVDGRRGKQTRSQTWRERPTGRWAVAETQGVIANSLGGARSMLVRIQPCPCRSSARPRPATPQPPGAAFRGQGGRPQPIVGRS